MPWSVREKIVSYNCKKLTVILFRISGSYRRGERNPICRGNRVCPSVEGHTKLPNEMRYRHEMHIKYNTARIGHFNNEPWKQTAVQLTKVTLKRIYEKKNMHRRTYTYRWFASLVNTESKRFLMTNKIIYS